MIKSIKDVNVKNKTVLVRVDYNLPYDTRGNIADDRRIRASLGTIAYLIEQRAKVVLMTHSGRPGGKIIPALSLEPAAARLSGLLKKEVVFVGECIGPKAEAAVTKANFGDVILLENLRFHAEETMNGMAFAKQLASLADLYVNESFATSHRAHASNTGICAFLPGVAGLTLLNELRAVSRALEDPAKPVVAVLGGAKVSDKIEIIQNLIDKADSMILGGGIANTFIKAKGYNTGASLVDSGHILFAGEMIELAGKKGKKLMLPVDFICGDAIENPTKVVLAADGSIPSDMAVYDVGPLSAELFAAEILQAGTVIFNGPPGVFEHAPYESGTRTVANALASSKAYTFAGGGDSAAAIEKFGCSSAISYISTGGGASLECLKGATLPGVEVLLRSDT